MSFRATDADIAPKKHVTYRGPGMGWPLINQRIVFDVGYGLLFGVVIACHHDGTSDRWECHVDVVSDAGNLYVDVDVKDCYPL